METGLSLNAQWSVQSSSKTFLERVDQTVLIKQGCGRWLSARIFGLEVLRSPNVSLSVCLCVRHTCYNYTGLLKDFLRTSKGLLEDFGLYALQNLLVYKSQPPGLWDLLSFKLQIKKIFCGCKNLWWSVLNCSDDDIAQQQVLATCRLDMNNNGEEMERTVVIITNIVKNNIWLATKLHCKQ